MKNNKIIYIVLMSFLFVFAGCESDYETMTSKITYYPTFDQKGDTKMVVMDPDTYSEPGVTASEDGNDLPVTIKVKGLYQGHSGAAIGTNHDIYEFSYSATNSDGYAGSVSRTVIYAKTGDLVNSIEGYYKAVSTRSTGEVHKDIDVIIFKTGANTYGLSHAIGGWYSHGRGYGGNYTVKGTVITANNIAANDFSFTSSKTAGWPNIFQVKSMEVDAATKTIKVHTTADFGGVWDVVLTQQ